MRFAEPSGRSTPRSSVERMVLPQVQTQKLDSGYGGYVYNKCLYLVGVLWVCGGYLVGMVSRQEWVWWVW